MQMPGFSFGSTVRRKMRGLWMAAFLCGACGGALAAPAFPALTGLIGEEPVHSAEDLLARLPETFRSRYVLVFNSRSLQGASFENPRVILFSADARLVLTFNGAPSQRGYAAIETMEFDPAASQFVLRELAFSATAAGRSEMQVSQPNPSKCLVCHGNPARPLWDSFPSWPGVYGENYQAPLSREEREGLDAFSTHQAQDPRYRYLADFRRYAAPETFHESNTQRYQGIEEEPPNSVLTTLLQRQNLQAIATSLQQSPRFLAYRYALLASLDRGCGDPSGYVPAALRRAYAASPADLEADARAKTRVEEAAKERRLLSGNHAVHAEPESLDRFRYLAELGLGMPAGQWTLALEKDTFDFTMRGPAGSVLEQALAPTLLQEDAAFGELFEARGVTDDGKYCAYLKRRSLAALAAVPDQSALAQAGRQPAAAAASGSRAQTPPALLERCILCHSENAVGPRIPFGQPDLLAAGLARGGYPKGTLFDEIVFRLSPEAGARRMPMGMNPSDSDRAELLDYLRARQVAKDPRPQSGS